MLRMDVQCRSRMTAEGSDGNGNIGDGSGNGMGDAGDNGNIGDGNGMGDAVGDGNSTGNLIQRRDELGVCISVHQCLQFGGVIGGHFIEPTVAFR